MTTPKHLGVVFLCLLKITSACEYQKINALGKLSPMKTKTHSDFAIAACVTDLSGKVPTEIQLTPAGLFKAKDGRPVGLSGWIVENENAQAVVQLANAQSDAFVIDYEHQTLYAKQNGMPAPAAGWFKNLQYREGLGLFATQVEWTDSAALAIQSKEYRYISPVIAYDPKTGAVTKVLMAAVTNNPALDGLSDLTALAANYFSQTTEVLSMDLDELLERLRYLFNLPTLATAEEIKAQMDKAKSLIDTASTETAAASSIFDLIAKKDGQIAALSLKTYDPTKFVPIETMSALQVQLATIQVERDKEKTERLVEVALSDGRLPPSQKEWALDAGAKDFAWLSARIEATPKNLALLGTQTGGKTPEGGDKPALTPEEVAVCSAMGLTHAQFIETKTQGEK